MEGSTVASFGKIHALEDDTLQIQNLVDDKNTYSKDDNNEESIILETSDIYKELRVRGYDYGPNFQGIQELRNESLFKISAKIKWSGSWVSFVDALLQSTIAALPIRKLFIPLIITSLKCDPKVLFEAIEDSKVMVNDEKDIEEEYDSEKNVGELKNETNIDLNAENAIKKYENSVTDSEIQTAIQEMKEEDEHRFVSILPMVCDIESKVLVTKGIEVNGLLAVPINRMIDRQGLKLESYEFIPNEENEAIEPTLKSEFTEYIEVKSF
jgi:hypothetical protein